MALVLTFHALIGAACQRTEASGPPAGTTVTDSAGVEFIAHHIPDDLSRPVALVETLRIGAASGDSRVLFDRITAMVVDDNGSIFVADASETPVREFDSDGVFVTGYSAIGDGPSEVRNVARLYLTTDGIAIVDLARGSRLLAFRRDGGFESSHALTGSDGLTYMPIGLTPDGWVGAVTDPRDYTRRLSAGESFVALSSIRTIDITEPSAGDTVHDLPPVRWHGTSDGTPTFPLFKVRNSIAFDGAGSMYRIAEDAYRIEKHAPGGGLVRVMTRTHEPVPITEDDIDELIAMRAAAIDTMQHIPLELRRNAKEDSERSIRERAALREVESVPPIADLIVSRDGTVWVRRSDRESPAVFASRWSEGDDAPQSDPQEWDVFGRDGHHVATVMTPPRFRAMAATRTSIHGVTADELDVEYVIRLDLPDD